MKFQQERVTGVILCPDTFLDTEFVISTHFFMTSTMMWLAAPSLPRWWAAAPILAEIFHPDQFLFMLHRRCYEAAPSNG